ncbi:10771_t:CDS:2 [Dentiscutata heterogama]|uniref:10771_t:CDS:1 n=1 Tax=Dentiscutata heterogama TaxID=1316150 RepID=A0ACA9KFH6_9GLOM|nr:10771_t:CDS:2 [Dentiscutata heterogama]
MSRKAVELQGILPLANYTQDSSASTTSSVQPDYFSVKDNVNNAKKKPNFVRRLKKFMASHCNRSRIVLLIIFLITLAAIITVVVILNKNPFVLIRPLCKSQFGIPSLNQTFIYLAEIENNQLGDDSSIPYNGVDSMGFIGKYKFGELMLSNLGYYKTNITIPPNNSTIIKNFWNGTWTGCNFQSDGLSVSNVTLAGILASSYLIEPENVGQALVSGMAPCDNKTTSTPTSLTRYLLDFAGCDFTPDNVNEAVSSFNSSNSSNTSNKTRVAHLVKSLSLDEDDWEKFDNQSMDMEYTINDSKDDNIDNWEPDRYEVDQIIAHKVANGRDLYLVTWKGYSKDTWEPAENLDDCREKLDEFHRLSDEMKIADQYCSQYEFDPEERDLFLNALHDSDRVNFDLYDKIILGRIKDFDYNDYASDPRIESVPIAEIGQRGRREEELKCREECDLF